ncbi:MAG TPA: hypothetical protein VFA15_04455, partial [Nitrososphaera sp.]|nr:hypothetical protein [Nitrososphaera sp.]
AQGNQIEAREIFQPDLMQELMEKFSKYTLQIKDTKIYVICDGPILKRSEFLAMHDMADSIVDKMIPSLRSVSEDMTPTSAPTSTAA